MIKVNSSGKCNILTYMLLTTEPENKAQTELKSFTTIVRDIALLLLVMYRTNRRSSRK